MTKPSIISPLLHTDAYKIDHRRQYPEGTEHVYSNFTNRGSRIPGINHVVHFGLQAFLQDYCMEAFEEFFKADEDKAVELYNEAIADIIGPNGVGEEHIRALHKKGYLPLRFCAVPEGTLVPLRVPSFTVENTDPEFFWLTNFIETEVSANYWHPSTVATLAHQYRILLDEWAEKTGGSSAEVDFQLHDFSYRGQAAPEAAGMSGLGHLLSFKGSDTLLCYDYARRFYRGKNGTILMSVPATEHSVMCAGGEDDEFGTYDHLLDLYPTGIVSIVSDTWDLWGVVTDILPKLKEKIMARDGKVVIRPDSGDPADILTGKLGAYSPFGDTPEDKGLIQMLWEEFGGTYNDKGYKVLDSHIGAIYGDSITIERARDICERLEANGFASTNVVFGVGSYSYQYVTRDTFGSAMKATWVQINGEGRAIQKAPKTDNGIKKSALGRLAVISHPTTGELILIENAIPEMEEQSLLQPIWEDGKFVKGQYQSLANVRETLASYRD